MTNIVSIEPSLFRPDTEAWFIMDDGRKLLRKLDAGDDNVARSSFPCPAIQTGAIAPTMGMDGKMYDNLSGYRRTLKASGNPQGENYIELGNESLKTNIRDFDRKTRRDNIKAAIADVKAGRVA